MPVAVVAVAFAMLVSGTVLALGVARTGRDAVLGPAATLRRLEAAWVRRPSLPKWVAAAAIGMCVAVAITCWLLVETA